MRAIMTLSVHIPSESELLAILCCVMTARIIHRKIKLHSLLDITMLLSVSSKLVDKVCVFQGEKANSSKVLYTALLHEVN